MKRVFLSLGSNLGERAGNIQKALDKLARAGMEVHRVSSFYSTEPVEFRQQPWFVNCVAEVGTDLMPMQLLKAVQRVELSLGRRRVISKGPRTIDIDILLYDNISSDLPELTLPHPRMEERAFVLIPLREIAPQLRLPSGRLITELTGEGQVRKLPGSGGHP